MIDMSIRFFKKIYNEDVIYHYTKTSTAIDYILFNEQLKFSGRVNSIDPTESRKASRSIVSTGHFADIEKDVNFHNESNQLNDIVSSLENSFNQISFCKNYMGHEFASENYSSQFEGHEEIFGFTKPRMWERYADNYSGVCLAFSRKKVLDLNEKRFKLICKDVEYLKYSKLTCRKVDYISGNYLLEVGYDKYEEDIKQIAESSFFCKHVDYDGENEFRIGAYYEEANCIAEEIKGEFQFGKTMMLDVKGCVEAIFISSYANLKQKKDLLNYAEKLNVPIIEMVWKHDSFQPIDYKQEVDFYKNLSQNVTDTFISS
jgi:hypothetical protein